MSSSRQDILVLCLTFTCKDIRRVHANENKQRRLGSYIKQVVHAGVPNILPLVPRGTWTEPDHAQTLKILSINEDKMITNCIMKL